MSAGASLPSRPAVRSLEPSVLFIASSVRARRIDGRVVLLDLALGTYVVFDAVATEMWRALLEVSSAQRTRELAERFDAPPERLERDLAAFERTCVERGYLAREESAPRSAAIAHGNPPSRGWTLLAWRSLATTTLTLRSGGFPAAYAAAAGLARYAPHGSRDAAALARAERAFLRAENAFVLRSAPKDCLPRSLALYRFLVAAGFAPEHRLGVQRYHFEAHGWVTCGGAPVIDTPQFVARYAELAVI